MRTLGYCYAWNPDGTRAAYHVISTQPGRLQLRYAGFIDGEGVRHPVSADWDRTRGHTFWAPRRPESYFPVFFEHAPSYGQLEPAGRHRERLWVMRCKCGFVKDNHTRGLAELEWEVHTGNLGQ